MLSEVEERFAGVRVLVAGASGFIGRWVARRLTEAGADLFLGVRDAATMQVVGDLYGISGTVLCADFRSEKAIRSLIRDVQPALTINAVGYGVDRAQQAEREMVALNELVPAHIATEMARYSATRTDWPGVQFLHVGSALEYGGVAGDLAEDGDHQPTSLYGRTKLAGTRAVAAIGARTGLRAVTARLFTVYGPGEHPGRLLPTILESRRRGERVKLSEGKQRRDFTFVADAAEALLRLGLSDASLGSVVNVATGRLCTVRRFVETAAEVLGMSLEDFEFGVMPLHSDEMEHDNVRIERLRRLVDWQPQTSVAEGIVATRDFLLQHPEATRSGHSARSGNKPS